MKTVRLYIDEDFIKEKMGDEYKNSNVIFTRADIGIDNTVTFTCLITEEGIINEDVYRTKIQ